MGKGPLTSCSGKVRMEEKVLFEAKWSKPEVPGATKTYFCHILWTCFFFQTVLKAQPRKAQRLAPDSPWLVGRFIKLCGGSPTLCVPSEVLPSIFFTFRASI